MTDDFDAPLGHGPQPRRRFNFPKVATAAIGAALAAVVAAFALWTLFVEDPLGGEPSAVVSAELAVPERSAEPRAKLPDAPGAKATAPAGAAPPSPNAAPAEAGEKPPAPGTKTVTIIDGTSGKREQVTIAAAPEPGKALGPDARLTEDSRHGPIPKVGPDGARPADVYAAAAGVSAGRNSGPLIAIVVGRLGVSGNALSNVLAKLPAPVTLAFTPYGNDLGRAVGRARSEGHEILLQVPMEPVDYPENDPGPQTLLTSLPPDQNTDRLQWSMSRFAGYVGVANFMGSRFIGNEQAMAAVLREVGKRGLIFFDDGASGRALAGQVASANNVSFAKADVVIDAAPTPAETAAALARLEATARERGDAVGVATALPVTIDRLAAWAKAASERGFTLVPISVIANKPKSS